MALPTHEELAGSPVENRAIDSFSAVRRFKVAWSDRVNFMNQLLEADNGFGQVYPFDTNSFARAVNAQAAPFGVVLSASDPDASYNHAVITIRYETQRANDPRNSGFGVSEAISESFEPFVENIRVPHHKFRWGGATSGEPLTADQSPVKPVYGINYVFTRHRMLNIPTGAFSLVGHVNASTVVTNFSGIPFGVETVLFKSVSADHTTRLGAGDTFRAVYRFGIREMGWNKFWRVDPTLPDGGAWQSIYVAEGGVYRNFPVADLTGI